MATAKTPFGLTCERTLGFGSSAYVFLINDEIALKTPQRITKAAPQTIKTVQEIKDSLKSVEREKGIYDLINPHPHPNILQSIHHGPEGIFMARHGKILQEIIAKEECTEPLRLRWAREIIAGAAWLEKLGLAHGDLRPSNILVDSSGLLKLSDFGATVKFGDELMAFTVPYDTGYLDHASTHTEQFGIASTLYKLFFGEEPEFEITGRPLKPDGFPEVKHALYGPIIRKCWLGYYSSIAELEAEVSKLDDGVEPPSRSLGIARLSGIPGGRYFSGFLGRLSHFLGTIWTVADKLGVSRLLPPLRRTPCETQSAKPAVLDEETLARLRKVCEDLQEEYKEDTAEFVSRDPEWE